MSAWVHGRGLVAWQWSSMARRAYSAIRSRLSPSSCPRRRGMGNRASTSSVRVIKCPAASPARAQAEPSAQIGHPSGCGFAVEPEGVR